MTDNPLTDHLQGKVPSQLSASGAAGHFGGTWWGLGWWGSDWRAGDSGVRGGRGEGFVAAVLGGARHPEPTPNIIPVPTTVKLTTTPLEPHALALEKVLLGR